MRFGVSREGAMSSRKRSWGRAGSVACVVALLTPFAAGCDGSGSKDAGPPGGAADGAGGGAGQGGGAAGLGGGAGAETPAFVIGTRVWDDTSTTSYFNVVSTLDAGTLVDLDDAIEVPGAAKLYAIEDVGWFAVGGGEDPSIARYVLSQDGELEEREKISLQSYGVQSLWDGLYVVSETKLYYPDRANGQLIVINPTEMVIEGVVQLPEAVREGYLSLYGYTPLLRDGKLLFTVGWFDWRETDSILGETGLVVLDTETDTVERFEVDERCGGITTGVVAGSGDAYFVSSALAAAAHRLGRLTTEPCALRVNAGEDSFDPGYLVKLADVTSSAISGEPVPAGGSGVFLRVFDEAQGTITDESATVDLTGQAAWTWWRWDLASGAAAPIESLAPSTADVLWFEVDGRVYGTQSTEDYSQTTLIELTSEEPQTALTVPGFVHGVARVR